MFLPEFIKILTETGVVADNQQSLCESCFFHSLLNSSGELKEMVFAEFLEAVADAAVDAVKLKGYVIDMCLLIALMSMNSDTNDAKKVRVAFAHILEYENTINPSNELSK